MNVASLEEITARLSDLVGEDSGLGKSVKLDFRDEGCIVVDGGVVSNVDRPADTTFTLSKSDFEDLAKGRMDPAMAMMRGRLKVAGDLSVLVKLKAVLGRSGG